MFFEVFVFLCMDVNVHNNMWNVKLCNFLFVFIKQIKTKVKFEIIGLDKGNYKTKNKQEMQNERNGLSSNNVRE